MKLSRTLTGYMILAAVLALFIGCSTAPPKAESETNWQFHTIVDAKFVEQQIAFPMPDNVMLIDARPKQVKYDKGHIPMAVSIPDSQFDKMTDLLPKDKNALLIYYCEGLACKLSHQSAYKAEALGYKNVKVYADGFPGWMQIPGHYASVSPEWMKQQLDAKTEMALVDARPKQTQYDKGHIPTAISIPDTYFDKMQDQLPQDKSKLLVFYCGGFACKLSHKSAAKAIDLGYSNVKVFSAGYPGWTEIAGNAAPAQTAAAPALKKGTEEGTIDHDTFKQIIAENPQSIYLVDVRDKDEFARGSLKTAVNIPVDQLEGKLASLPTDKPIVFICGTGARSGESYYMVKDLKPELKNVFYLDGMLSFSKDGSFTLKKSA